MQALKNKKLIIWLSLGIILAPLAGFCKGVNELKMADSLFAIARYQESYLLYKKNFTDDEKNNESLLLKLAFLSEKTNNYTECLYYLNKLALTKPSRRLFEKMAKLAEEQNLSGYEFDDYNYFIIFYRSIRCSSRLRSQWISSSTSGWLRRKAVSVFCRKLSA